MSPNNPSTQSVVNKIDELLEDDRQLSTRTGLRFMTTILKEALQVIGEASANDNSILFRLNNVEKGLNDFLHKRESEQKEAADERKFYRRAVIGGLIAIGISELARWFFG